MSRSRLGRARIPGWPIRMGALPVVAPEPVATQVQAFPVHLFPPPEAENLDFSGYVLLPAIAATATVVEITVPPGRNGILRGIANNFVGGGWVEGTGDVVWRLQRNGADFVQGYDNILTSLGNPSNPTIIPGFIRILEGEVITLQVFNNAVVVAGQRSGGRLLGWFYPREYEENGIFV